MEVRELCISCSFNFDFKNVQVFNLVYWIHNLFMFTESGVIPQASCKGFPKLQINPDGRKLTTLDTSSIHEHLVVYNPGHPIIHRARDSHFTQYRDYATLQMADIMQSLLKPQVTSIRCPCMDQRRY